MNNLNATETLMLIEEVGKFKKEIFEDKITICNIPSSDFYWYKVFYNLKQAGLQYTLSNYKKVWNDLFKSLEHFIVFTDHDETDYAELNDFQKAIVKMMFPNLVS